MLRIIGRKRALKVPKRKMTSEDRMLEASRCLCPECNSEANMVDFPGKHKSNRFHGLWECVNDECKWTMSIWE